MTGAVSKQQSGLPRKEARRTVQLDVMTLIGVLIIGHLLVCCLFLADFAEQGKSGRDNVFIGAKLAQLIGWCLISQRAVWPDVYTFSIANLLMIGGHACEAFALTSLKTTALQRWKVTYLLATGIAYGFLLTDAVEFRCKTAVIMAIIALFYQVPGAYLLFSTERRSLLQNIVGLMCTLLCVAGLWRAAYLWNLLQYDLFAAAAAQTGVLSMRIVMLFSGSMGYILIKKEFATKEIKRIAKQDFLTGIYNRRAFFEDAAAMVGTAQKNGDGLALLMLDIDHFKQINDCHGHQLGDDVIKTIAALARQQCGNRGIAGRFGGEEFAVLLPDCTLSDAVAVGEALRLAVANYEGYGPKGLTVTISVGVTALEETKYADCRYGIDELIGFADQALYKAKASGRNCVKCEPLAAVGLQQQA